MLQISQALMIGVTGGLIAALIAIGFQKYWDRVSVPWYGERLYKDADIGGAWNGIFMYHNNEKEEFICDIHRKGHKVTGEMINKQDGKFYDFHGEFRNMILTLNYESRIRQEVDRGCFTFLLLNNGQDLEGLATYYHNPDHTVQIGAMKLTRQDDTQEFENVSEEGDFRASNIQERE